MGRHTEEFRTLIAHIPSHSNGLTPKIARTCIIQIANSALQVIAQLEEMLEDKDKEIDKLTEKLLEGNDAQIEWMPTKRG
jgi:hypothetical protein